MLRIGQSVVSRTEAGILPLTVEMLAVWASAIGTTDIEVLTSTSKFASEFEHRGIYVVFTRPRGKECLKATAVVALMLVMTKEKVNECNR